MLVRFIGFAVTVTTPFDLALVLQHTQNLNPKIQKLTNNTRLLFIDSKSHEKYHLGMVVTVKDQKRFCELQNAGGGLSVKVNRVTSNASIMDFNFFAINKANGFGLYQHYHHSCSLGAAMSLLKKTNTKLKEDSITREIKASGAKENSAKSKRIHRKYKGTLFWEFLVRKETLENILREMKKIKSLSVDYLTLDPNEREFEQLDDTVKRERKKFRFKNDLRVGLLAKKISSVVKSHEPYRGRIEAIDEDDIERVIRVVDTPENFGEHDYDDVADQINALEISKFQDSWVIAELIRACESNSHIFDSKPKE